MKQLVKLFGRQARNQATEVPRRSVKRPLRNETLESRQLLAGDLLIAHNYAAPEDVNADWNVTPLDALLVLNHISKNGGNPSLEGIDPDEIEHYLDVSGDNQVTPLDALLVLNRIARGEAMSEVLELQVNPRTAGDEAFSAAAFNASTRELTVGVDEIFNLEVLYRDLRPSGIGNPKLGAFAIYADVLFDPAGEGVLQPVLTETQFLQFSSSIRQSSGGEIDFTFPDSTETITVDFEDFVTGIGTESAEEAAARNIREAIEQLGYSDVTVQPLPGAPESSLDFLIRYNDFSLVDQDIPNLVVTPRLNNTVTAQVDDIKPRNPDGSINNAAIPFNLSFDSRTMREPRDESSGDSFFGFAGSQVGNFDAAVGFTDVGAVGELLVNGWPDAGLGALPDPFDAFSIPVRLTQPIENLRIFIDPPTPGATTNLMYGSPSEVPADLIRIEYDVEPFIAGNGTINTEVDTPATIDLDNLFIESGLADGTGVLFVNAVTDTSNVDNSTVRYEIDSQPARGVASLDGSVITYTPAAGDVTIEPLTFSYTAFMGSRSSTGTISINIDGEIPELTVVANDGSLTAVENGGPVTIDLAALVAVTGSSATPTFTVGGNPARGSVQVDGTIATYTPAADEIGTDSFTYTATVGDVSDSGTIAVTIEAAPVVTVVADDGSLTAVENGGPVTIDLAPLVAVTGSTAAPTFTVGGNPARGSVEIDGSIATYTPAADEVGADSFTYTATVGDVSATATISVTIEAAPVVTIMADDGSLTAVENGGPVTIDLAELVAVTGSTATPTFTIDGNPTRGSVVINGTVATYTPAADEIGADSFIYTASIGDVSDSGTIAVTIEAAPVVTVVANDGSLDAVENGGPVTIDLAPLVAVTGSTATPVFTIGGNPTRGSVVIDGTVATYTPAADEAGTDSFIYTATVGGVSDSGTIAVTIAAAPQVTVVANDGSLNAVENGGPVTINLAPLVAVTGSTAAPVFTITGQPTRGTVSVSNGTATYTPSSNQFGTDTFVYRATVNGVSDTGTITVTIAPIEMPPVARDDNFNVVAGVSTTFSSVQLTNNDDAARPNPSGQRPLVTAATAIAGTTVGTVTFNAGDNSVTYTPTAGFTGTDSFRYTITSEGQTASAIVTVSVRDFVPSTISGMVFTDFIESISNPVRNGIRDADEPAVGGVPIRLQSAAGDNALGEAVDRVIWTNADGGYRFTNVAPGRYTVTFEMPNTLVFGMRANSSGLPVDGWERSFEIEIGSEGGATVSGLNFTVIGRTGSAAGSGSLLTSDYLVTDPSAPQNINNPNFGLLTMVVNPATREQQLFEVTTGFDDVLFAEIAVSQSGETALLTVIMDDGAVRTYGLSREAGDFVVSANEAVVKVLRNLNSLTQLDSADAIVEAQYGNYRNAVDQVLAAGIV